MKVLIAGDYAPIGRIDDFSKKGDFSFISSIKPLLQSVDYSIVNLECPVADLSFKPIKKIGPNLRCSRKGVEALSLSGFKCVALANNHFNDYGAKGIEETINAVEDLGMEHVGGGMDYGQASRVLYTEVAGSLLAVINCCEHEFSVAENSVPGSNPLNPIVQYKSIQVARQNADFVLVITHGGHEGYQLPSPRMQETYRFFVDAGADAVVNHHQHCFSGYEVYKGKPIFYGLGNFCFDRFSSVLPPSWSKGYMTVIDFGPDEVRFELIPYNQCRDEAVIELLHPDAIRGELESLNSIISDPVALEGEFNRKCESLAYSMLIDALAPTGNRYILSLMRHHVLPSFISPKRIMLSQNIIRCEAHRDVLLCGLKQLGKNK